MARAAADEPPQVQFVSVTQKELACRWFFGAAATAQGSVVCAPFGKSVLVMNPNQTVRAIPGAGAGACKWLGAVAGADGRVYFVPWSAETALAVTPPKVKKPLGLLDDEEDDDEDEDVGEITYIKGAGSGQCKWAGAAFGKDGKIYCAPFNASSILVIKPKKEELALFGDVGRGRSKWAGAALGRDGNVYCAPFDADSVLVIHPESRELSFIGGAGVGPGKWFGAAVGTDGNVYCAPYNAGTVLVIDTSRQELSHIGGVGDAVGKWSGAAAAADGSIYCAPWNAEAVLVINPGTQQVSFLGDVGRKAGKWFGAAATGEQVVFAPFNAATMLVLKAEPKDPMDRRYNT